MREDITVRELVQVTATVTGRTEEQVMDMPVSELKGMGGSKGKIKSMQGFKKKKK